jgi:hypothetical protein
MPDTSLSESELAAERAEAAYAAHWRARRLEETHRVYAALLRHLDKRQRVWRIRRLIADAGLEMNGGQG